MASSSKRKCLIMVPSMVFCSARLGNPGGTSSIDAADGPNPLVFRLAVGIPEVLLHQQLIDAIVQTVVALLGVEQELLEVRLRLSLGQYLAKVSLVVEAIGIGEQHGAFVLPA